MEGGRPLRWVAIALAAIVAVVVAAGVIAYATIDTQAIARYAADEVSRLTGRRIEARGPVSLALWPRLSVVAHDVTISNPTGASRPEFAHAKLVRGAVATWPLLRYRAVVADSIELEGLDLLLETLPDGRRSWQFGDSAKSAAANASTSAAGTPFQLSGTIVLVDAKVTWRPPDGGPPTVVTIPRLELKPEEAGRYAWKGTIDVGGFRYSVDATSGAPIAAWRDRMPLDLEAKVQSDGIALTAKGRLEMRDSGPGAVLDASLAWDAGGAWMTNHAPALARHPGQLAARVDARSGRYALGGIAGKVDGMAVDGTLSLETGGKVPKLRGRLHADAVDLGRGRVATTPTPAAQHVATAPSDVRAPTARLSAIDADVDFVVDRIHLQGTLDATNARGRVVVAEGKLAAEPLDVEIAGGRVTGRVQADASSGRARVVADGRGIELARVLGGLNAARDLSGGPTTFSVDLDGPAASSERFVAGASGMIRVDVGPMQVRGVVLDAGGEVVTRVLDTLNPFRRVDPSTEVQCFVAVLPVRGGVAHAERTLAIETSRLTGSASGTIDLGKSTLDLLVRPRARKLAAMPSVELAEIVRVSGPIAHPSVRVDSMGAAKTALTIGGAIATGGWSLLATPLLNAADDPNPCATARAGGKPSNAPATATASHPTQDLLGPLRDLFKR